MAYLGEKAAKQLGEITECSICMSAFKDPRMLTCIHTFCLECLKRTAEADQKKPGESMTCPLCRKDFILPADGVIGLQRNFFMENLLEFEKTLKIGCDIVICDMCNARNDGKTREIPKATMRCFECQDNYCDSCVKVHQFQKLSRNHQLVEIGSEAGMKPVTMCCIKHHNKPLNYYCADCKKIVCVLCFVESHASHNCKDVTTVDEEFRYTIQWNSSQASIYAAEMLAVRMNSELRKADFLEDIVDTENAIQKRNQELKDMIDEHTKLLLDELIVIKSKHLKEMETQMQEIDKYCTMLKSFEAYCTKLVSEGSPSDICSSVDQIIVRTGELGRELETFIGRPQRLVEVSFQATDLREAPRISSNVVGEIKETISEFEKFSIALLLTDSEPRTDNVIKINLKPPMKISTPEELPATVYLETVAAVYCNTMYVAGMGHRMDEIWKYDMASDWKRCAASLVHGRKRHSGAFVDEVLYICGGYVDSNQSALDSVEALNAVTDTCQIVGKLVHCVQYSGNCVPFRSSLYIFGGKDKYYKDTSHVQVYNTKQNTCTLLTKPMPGSSSMMRAALWKTSAFLIGQNTCFIFDFEEEAWQERKRFKTEVRHFGVVLANERIYVIGGGNSEKNIFGDTIWRCRDDVRYVPLQNILQDEAIEWKIYGKLPRPSLVQVCGEMWMTV